MTGPNPELPNAPAGVSLALENWGRTDYAEALARQAALQTALLEGHKPDTLVLTEHEPVFTLGLRAGADRHLVWDVDTLARERIALHPSNRGGDITYHGPGQLVAYPIVNLERRRDLHAYMRFLEEVLIAVVARHGLAATRREGLTGIWIANRKIAAIGVSVRRWVTMHGVALNVAPDLRHFGGIVPCGIVAADGSVTSLAAELGESCPVLERVGRDFAEEFSSRWPSFLTSAKT